MIKIRFKILQSGDDYQKNVLYQICSSMILKFIEHHAHTSEVVYLDYKLKENQFGIYANEYRDPSVEKEGSKTADILACVVDEESKTINTFLADVKSNISAFSDNLLRDGAMLTAIKEVRDFTAQIYEERLYKNSLFIYYKAQNYQETENFCIITKNFEPEKFKKVSQMLSDLFEKTDERIPKLIETKLKTDLRPYLSEKAKLEKFAEKKIILGNSIHDLTVILLEKDHNEYAVHVEIGAQ